MNIRKNIATWLLDNGFVYENHLVDNIFFFRIFFIVTTIIFCMNIFQFHPCQLFIDGEYSLLGSTAFSLLFSGSISYVLSVFIGSFLASFCKKEIKQAYKEYPEKVIWSK